MSNHRTLQSQLANQVEEVQEHLEHVKNAVFGGPHSVASTQTRMKQVRKMLIKIEINLSSLTLAANRLTEEDTAQA